MIVQINCPNCSMRSRVGEESIGRRGKCKRCGHIFALERSGEASASSVGEPSGVDTSAAVSMVSRAASAPPDLPALNIPEEFGRYRISRLLGRGGMGAVYLAHDTTLGRSVALKVPFFDPHDGPEMIRRFEREAKTAATLDHPNLCPVFDVGQVDGIHYLTMPYIDGKPLAAILGGGRKLPEAQAAAIVRKLALALQVAHEAGILHRDLKPANIMVSKHRDLVIMDFGLARRDGGGDASITRTGIALGTALYMAPEQAGGDPAKLGPTCDIYSLGVILYEMLAGVRPFEGPWSLVIGMKNVSDPEPPSKHRPELTPGLSAICHKAIAKKPEDRYATMAEFATALGTKWTQVAPTESVVEVSQQREEVAEMAESQLLAGLITREESRVRAASPLSGVKAAPTPPRGRRASWPIIAAAAGALALFLGIIIYVATDKGQIKIEINDPKATVKVDGQVVTVESLGKPISVCTGDHNLSIQFGDGTIEAKEFTVRRGQDVVSFAFEPKERPEPPHGTDALQAGTTWTGTHLRIQDDSQDTYDITFTVLERSGDTFKARFAGPNNVRELKGKIKDGQIGWLVSDVIVNKGDKGFDTQGTIRGDQIELKYKGMASTNDRPVSGTVSLRLKKGRAGNSEAEMITLMSKLSPVDRNFLNNCKAVMDNNERLYFYVCINAYGRQVFRTTGRPYDDIPNGLHPQDPNPHLKDVRVDSFGGEPSTEAVTLLIKLCVEHNTMLR